MTFESQEAAARIRHAERVLRCAEQAVKDAKFYLHLAKSYPNHYDAKVDWSDCTYGKHGAWKPWLSQAAYYCHNFSIAEVK